MLKTKIVEIRDRSTRIDAVVINLSINSNSLSRNDLHYLAHSGFGNMNHYALSKLDDQNTKLDPYNWATRDYPNRTMVEAHKYLQSLNFDDIPNHWVIDVETILGEESTMKVPERYNNQAFIQFYVNPMIELSDIDATLSLLDKEYGLDISSWRIDDIDQTCIVMITKESIIQSGIRFYEVLKHYLEVVGGRDGF